MNAKMLGARVLTTGGNRSGQRQQVRGLAGLMVALSNPDSDICRVILVVQTCLFVTALLDDWFVGSTDSDLMYICVVLFGHALLRRAMYALRALRMSIQLLMFLVAMGAAFLGQFREAATVVLAVSLSEWLVQRVHSGVEAALNNSLVGQATHAIRVQGWSQSSVRIEELKPGDRILLKTGEAVPVDGKIAQADSLHIDESSVTGEAHPMQKQQGALAFSGTVVSGGSGILQCTATAEDSFQGRMKKAVDEARNVKSQTDELVNYVASFYTPFVVLGSIGIAIATGEVTRGLAALVSACPCALIAAAPVAQACTVVRLLTDRQVLIKSARALESLARLNVLAVDKTGTLTNGRFEVVDTKVLPKAAGKSEATLMRLLAALESKDPHPLASSIVRAYTGCAADFAAGKGAAAFSPVRSFTRMESLGVYGTIEDMRVGAGSAKFLESLGIAIPCPAKKAVREWEETGGVFTTVYMTIEERPTCRRYCCHALWLTCSHQGL
eukprot:TRINITY_DN17304_c0_g1_i2.p1 TRINITY_DN17304_c0_g1~~TRINITY_DN17304_c0_g1_i2.p1  ORF type:complete len:498 (+),score=100.63 TRINITY_DN17304_c0_g1_i2:430-1923(+)